MLYLHFEYTKSLYKVWLHFIPNKSEIIFGTRLKTKCRHLVFKVHVLVLVKYLIVFQVIAGINSIQYRYLISDHFPGNSKYQYWYCILLF